MPGKDDLDAHSEGALDRLVEIINFKPEKDAVPIGTVVRIPDCPMIMLDLEAMKLQDEISIGNKALVIGAAVIAPATEQLLIPSAASFDVGYSDQGLGAHQSSPLGPDTPAGETGTRRTARIPTNPTTSKTGPIL